MLYDSFTLVWLSILACLWLIGIVVSDGSEGSEQDQPDGAADEGGKGRRRRPEERGLPKPENLRSLAQTYLECQNRLWPELRGSDEVPAVTDEAIDMLASQFTAAFFSKTFSPKQLQRRGAPWTDVAAAYVRYSCDNSNPRSLDQQLRLILERARQNGHFIPWDLVFADAAVTGTTALRIGYQHAKSAVKQKEMPICTLYIDEVGRASRDMVEAMLLGKLLVYAGKRLIGVSDGCDTNNPAWQPQLSIFSALQEWFVSQLRSKVNRGMVDAHRRGTSVGLPPIGYVLVTAVDEEGRVLRGKDGEELKMLAIDERAAEYVRTAFDLFVNGKWSMTRIAKLFNAERVGNRATWHSSNIRQLLERWKYVGIDVYGRKRNTIDPATGKIHAEIRPRKEWRARRARNLQIVSRKLWKQARQRLQEVGEAFSQENKPFRKRTHVYPTTLVRPICGHCGAPLWFGRSGKYAVYTCGAGKDGRNGCELRGYKSVRIVEKAILDAILQLLTDEYVSSLVERANLYLEEEAKRPPQDTTAMHAELKEINRKLSKLTKALEADSDSDMSTIVNRVKKYEKRRRQLQAEITELEAQRVPVERLDLKLVQKHIADLRNLLQGDVAVAACLLQELVGPVTVHQRKEEGKEKPVWIATFSLNGIPVLRTLAGKSDCPTIKPLEYLSGRSWTNSQSVEVRLENVAPCDQFGQKFAELTKNGATVNELASAYGMSWEQANEIVQFGLTGIRPKWQSSKKKSVPPKETPKYLLIQEDVVFLRDQKERKVHEIVEWIAMEKGLVVSGATVRRAYDLAKQGRTRAALEAGEKPQKAPWRFLPEEKVETMRALISEGNLYDREIAKVVGVGRNTVPREREAMLRQKAS